MCDFDAKFIDSTLWLEGRRIGALPIPEGKYLLGDAGFANCDTCITPYRGVRYHLKEWASTNKSPQNKEELFNLRHSRLRNVIERSFGILKGRFKILTIPRAFKIEAQVRIVPALCVLNNILINIREEIDLELEAEDPEDSDSETVQDHRGFTITNAELQRIGKRETRFQWPCE